MMRGYRYRLYPTAEQQAAFRQFAGVCRLVYNLALEQRRDFWRQYRAREGCNISFPSQSRELADLRAQFDWIAAVPHTCETQALRDLDKAYSNFFRGTSAYPTHRRKGGNESFRFQGRETAVRRISRKWSYIKVPKSGWVKFRHTRDLRGDIRNATVSRDNLGWFVSLTCKIEHVSPANELPSVGIDRGVANTVALSDGKLMSVPASLDLIDARLRQSQRVLARRKKGSKRRLRQWQRTSRLAAKRARIRKDWHHKASMTICRKFGVVVIEDLKIAAMTAGAAGTIEAPGRNVRQKAGLNRSIMNQGWYAFETMLAYKLAERGGHLIKVDPAYTSQTCSECGIIDKQSRKSQAIFACQHCGFAGHADTNAAINILRRNTAWTREEGRLSPVEPRTGLDREVHENHPALVA